LAKSQPVSQLAAEHQVSRKFVYEQGQKAKTAMDATFERTKERQRRSIPSARD
jgi:hypothetical protein